MKTLWMVWKVAGFSGEDAHAAELGPAAAPELLAGGVSSSSSASTRAACRKPGGLVVVGLGAARGLGDDPVDHAQVQAVEGVRLERGGGLLRLAGVAPEDRRTASGVITE